MHSVAIMLGPAPLIFARLNIFIFSLIFKIAGRTLYLCSFHRIVAYVSTIRRYKVCWTLSTVTHRAWFSVERCCRLLYRNLKLPV